MTKRTSRKKRGRTGIIPIRQNRPNWRKEVIGHKKINSYQKPQKIKGENYIKV